jgi:DICT domain-containing protein
MTQVSNGELTTAQLAERTGVSPGTLRMWESRHGFPAPARLPGGHRRDSEDDVRAVRDVARLRGQGLSMPGAIERVRRSSRPPGASIFAGLRRARPEVPPAVMSKRTLLVVTRAFEDEYCARGERGLLVGAFQRAQFYDQARHRWTEVARTAALAVAIADFGALREPPGAAVEVPIAHPQPLAREWSLVVDADGLKACLCGWELASQSELPDGLRRFEVLWSFEPQVVRAASLVAIELLRGLAPEVACRAEAALDEPDVSPNSELRSPSALTHRVVAYLARLEATPTPA